MLKIVTGLQTHWDWSQFFLIYFIFGPTVRHVGSEIPDQRTNLCSLHWKHNLNQGSPKGLVYNFT